MSLYSETTGCGPDLVLLHGWGAHSGVWAGLRDALAENFRVTCIDLPGHGQSPYQAGAMDSLPALAEAVLSLAPSNASWLGWSLGGLVAQQAAFLEPGRVEKLILLGSTPSFIMREGWPYAVDPAVFETFHQDLINDSRATLLRFIALQTRGSKQAGDDARLLKRVLLQPPADSEALQAGLNLLRQADLREQAGMISAPVLLLAGARDTLLPKQALPEMAGLFQNAAYERIGKAGHAPFLSHRDETLNAINAFLMGIQETGQQHV
jgi:pimeloyl-[acyl-carrier protein] methyl ester esterase